MCGIAGIFDTRGQQDYPRELMQRMNDIQSHRGPDESGYHFEPGVAFAHRRLSIIDLSTGQQPLFNEDGCKRARVLSPFRAVFVTARNSRSRG